MRSLTSVICLLLVAGCATVELRPPPQPSDPTTTASETTAPSPTTVATALVQPPSMPSAALDDSSVLTRIAFGSCYVPQLEESDVWTVIAGRRPDVFLFLGDNVYQSEEKAEPELRELREAYAALADDEPFTALRAAVPVLTTWDDHDYGLNDAGADFPVKYESEALFEHVWAIADDDPRARRDGIYVERVIGPPTQRVQLILLDTRFFRSAREAEIGDGEPPTMLGAAQWKWLEAALRERAEVRVLASSIPVLSQSDHGESWHGWPSERQRLLTMLAASSGRVVLISGDSHFGAFYRRDTGAAGPLLELTSSSLNFPMPQHVQESIVADDPARIGRRYFEANFGLVAIDWSAHRIAVELYDSSGTSLAAQHVPIAGPSDAR